MTTIDASIIDRLTKECTTVLDAERSGASMDGLWSRESLSILIRMCREARVLASPVRTGFGDPRGAALERHGMWDRYIVLLLLAADASRTIGERERAMREANAMELGRDGRLMGRNGWLLPAGASWADHARQHGTAL